MRTACSSSFNPEARMRAPSPFSVHGGIHKSRARQRRVGNMVLSPMELNSLGDDELRQHVEAVLNHLNDPTSLRKWVKVAPFVTADILLRLHNLIASARRDNNQCGGWSKQATLARVVGCFTGIDIKQSDAEYIGNAEDYFLHNYIKHLTKARKTDKMRAHRARKAGKELPADHGTRERELKLQVYTCKFGGVPRNMISRDAENVPVRTMQHADDINKRLQEEIIKLKEQNGLLTSHSSYEPASKNSIIHVGTTKGKGPRSYNVWLRETYPSDFTIHLERADGGRQDLDYDAAVPLYVNRKYFIEFLHERVFLQQHSNILENFLYVTFSSQQYIAMARANALVDVLISRPLRWLSGKSSQLQDWSPRSMGKALDLVEQFFEQAQHNGSLFLDPNVDIFKPIAEDQPQFAEWRRF